jgi:putative phosphoesterase
VIVGVISDTHGLLREEALDALQGSDLIIHAGDVGKPAILETLRAVAPVVAVRGNVDQGPWTEKWPATAVTKAGTALLYVLHNLHDLDVDPVAAGYHVVVSGHSHKPGCTDRDGVLYLNPGSAGPCRFHLPVTVALLDLGATPWIIDFINLSGTDRRVGSPARARKGQRVARRPFLNPS